MNFARNVPHGLLVFFPSYPLMFACKDSWHVSLSHPLLSNSVPGLISGVALRRGKWSVANFEGVEEISTCRDTYTNMTCQVVNSKGGGGGMIVPTSPPHLPPEMNLFPLNVFLLLPYLLLLLHPSSHFFFKNQESGILQRIEQYKPSFWEPRRKIEFNPVSYSYS